MVKNHKSKKEKQSIYEAIILAGGMGTRLRPIVSDRPKPLALVAGKPFIFYLLDQLIDVNIKRVVISVGYMSDKIVKSVGNSYKSLQIDYSIESNPLGTGGALLLAIKKLRSSSCLILNGDTYFDMNYSEFIKDYLEYCESSVLSIAVMPRLEGSFGFVNLNKAGVITYFGAEQKKCDYVSAGRYILDVEHFLWAIKNYIDDLQPPLSFEIQILPSLIERRIVRGRCFNGNFIDIGTPETYERAQFLLMSQEKL